MHEQRINQKYKRQKISVSSSTALQANTTNHFTIIFHCILQILQYVMLWFLYSVPETQTRKWTASVFSTEEGPHPLPPFHYQSHPLIWRKFFHGLGNLMEGRGEVLILTGWTSNSWRVSYQSSSGPGSSSNYNKDTKLSQLWSSHWVNILVSLGPLLQTIW